ncbi:hypothetical protein [Streptomyces sp. NPDC093109]|uniref:hypothetical protein n=1 Tax=Streptomyces sp. NPDC093109 TaxID=3154977 RepID=UPI00344DDA10
MVLSNNSVVPLELTVEPWADIHWMPPMQACVVVTHSPATDGSWSGTLRRDESFRVDHRPDSITVWVNGSCFHLSDADGNAINAADWHCPAQNPAS